MFEKEYEVPPWILENVPRPEMAEPHIGHKSHLCEMAENGIVTLDQYKSLVKDAKFICAKCGRVAAKEYNLCEPKPL